MQLITAFTAIGLASLAFAAPQMEKRGTYETGVDISGDYYSNYNSAPTPTPAADTSATATTHDVWVGGTAGLVYTPEYITANVGDVVTFHFGTKNHTLTQSTFAIPCGKMDGGITFYTPANFRPRFRIRAYRWDDNANFPGHRDCYHSNVVLLPSSKSLSVRDGLCNQPTDIGRQDLPSIQEFGHGRCHRHCHFHYCHHRRCNSTSCSSDDFRLQHRRQWTVSMRMQLGSSQWVILPRIVQNS
jgi:plastocyanin